MPSKHLSTGAALHYEDLGNPHGMPLIALHGLMGTGRYDLGEVLDWLAADGRYRVIAPSLRGYGASTPKPRDFPHRFYERDAADLLALIAALDLPRAYLLGYSDGGEVALIAAAQQPEHFRKVVVWGAVGHFTPALLPAVQRLYPPTWVTPEQLALHGLERPEPIILGWIRAMKQMIETGGDVSLSTAHRITVPLLMLLGAADLLNPIALGQTYIARTPHGQLQTFPCGHAIHRDLPAAFQAAVSTFLSQ